MSTVIASLITAVVVSFVMAVGMWSFFTAQRLHRLHIRVDSSLDQLRAALDRRAAVVAVLDPALQPVAVQTESTEIENFSRRASAERALERQIMRQLPSPPPQLVEANTRVQLAHRFYNEAVADTRALRLRPAVKALHLGGRAALPEFFELPTPQIGEVN